MLLLLLLLLLVLLPLEGLGGRGLVGEGVRGGPSASSGDGITGGGPVTVLSDPKPLSGLVFTPSVDLLRLSNSVDANATSLSNPELIRSCQSASPSAKWVLFSYYTA